MTKKGKSQIQVKQSNISESFFRKFSYELLIGLFTFLLYANSISHSYNMDDELVTINHRLTSRGISAIPQIFTSPYYQDEMGYAYEYRPIVLASFAIEHQLFGENPRISHFINVLLYALCCVLLYRVLLVVLSSVSPILLVAITLLFAVHPAHTEVVCSIKNRDEIFVLILALFSLLIAYKAIISKRAILFLLLPVIFMLSLMSKMSGIGFAVIIPIAVILFTQAEFKWVVFISFLLALPSFFLINVGSLYQKILIEFGLIIAVAVFYGIYHIKRLWQIIMKALQPTSNSDSSIAENKNYKKTVENLTDFLAGIVFLAGFFFNYPTLVLAGSAGLLLLTLHKDKGIAWRANIVLYACLSLAYLNYYTPSDIDPWTYPSYIDLLFIVLVYQVFWGNRDLFIPSLICAVTVVAKSVLIGKHFPMPEIIFIAACRWWRWKITWPIIGFALSIIVVETYGTFTNSGFMIWKGDNWGGIFAFVLVLSLLLQRGTKQLVWVSKLVIVVFLLGFQSDLRLDKASITNFSNNVHKNVDDLGNTVSTNILNAKQDRPIGFIEQPVKRGDSWQVRLGTSLEILFHYLHKVVLPYPMAFYYGYKFIKPEKIDSIIPLISLFLYSILGCTAILFIRKHKMIAFSLIIYLVSIAAVSNYFISVPGQMAERFLFIPSLGWSMLVMFIVFKLFKATVSLEKATIFGLPNGIKYSFATLFCLYSAITFSRNFDWKDDLTLFRNDIGYVDQSAQAHNLLALHIMQYSEKEQNSTRKIELYKEALLHFKKAKEIYPYNFNVCYDIGRVYLSLQMPDSAIVAFKYALTIDSTFTGVYLNLGDCYLFTDRPIEAIPYYCFLIKNKPHEFMGYDKLSYSYFKLNEFDKAIEICKNAIVYLPNLPDPYINIGRTYIAMNQLDSAQVYFQKALEISPNNPSILQFLQKLGKR